MIQASQAYRDAIVGSPREIELFAVVDISDPDKSFLPATASPGAPWSQPQQLYDHEFGPPPRYGTLERNRWRLDGSFDTFPDSYRVVEPIGYASNILSGPGGTFDSSVCAQIEFTGVGILQACSVFFSGDPLDGTAEEFKVEVFVGSSVFFTQTVTGNEDSEVNFRGFTVYTPTAIKVTVLKWSRPDRRARISEIIMGTYERWTSDMLASFTATLQGQFSCLSLPYGSVNLEMDNADRRFEPRRKDSIFQSIEERQGVEIYLGCKTSEGVVKMKLGMFYQAGDGWKTSDNSLTMKWYLVDIIGLVSGRTFIPPDNLPTTLEGWLKAIVIQLGENFSRRYRVDPAYANKAVTANSREDVTGKKCGDIIRWVCQATGTWPRARQEDGALTAEPLWNQGNKYDLDNLTAYPTMKANDSLAALIFQLALPPLPEGQEDTRQREYVVSGNSTNSEKTVTIINPFIHTTDQALAASRLILAQYGGSLLELTGRGDPSSEIGDVDTVWLDESNATTARRMMQTFQFQSGVMQGCRSTLLQADGSYLYTEFAVMDRDDGYFTAPAGVTEFRLVLSDGGQGGSPGSDGWIGLTGNLGNGFGSGYGDPGEDGQGGRVWYGVIHINPGETVAYHRGRGGVPSTEHGKPGQEGEHSTFGVYSSAEGQLYPNGYTDIANGQAFCRPGVEVPLPGTGDGGKGGKGGDPGEGYLRTYTYTPSGAPSTVVNTKTELVVTKEPGPGGPGMAGASGFIMLTWAKPGT